MQRKLRGHVVDKGAQFFEVEATPADFGVLVSEAAKDGCRVHVLAGRAAHAPKRRPDASRADVLPTCRPPAAEPPVRRSQPLKPLQVFA